MLNYQITENVRYNSHEVTFNAIPEKATREALKALKMRWNPARGVWYGFASAEQIEKAIQGEKVLKAKADHKQKEIKIDLSGLDSVKYLGNYGAELSKVIRAELKKRGAQGVSVRNDSCGYTSGIAVTVTLSPSDFVSVEELERRDPSAYERALMNYWWYDGKTYTDTHENINDAELEKTYYIDRLKNFTRSHLYNHSKTDRNSLPELTAKAAARVDAIFKIANADNYDRSDNMTDYFDVGYYINISFKMAEEFEPRETMTAEERKAIEKEEAAEAKKLAEDLARYEKEQEEARKAAEEYAKKAAADWGTINNAVTVKDIEQSYFITGLDAGIGKEININELKYTINEYGHKADARITREIYFANVETFNLYVDNYLMDDWGEIAKHGGTGWNDYRVTAENFNKLNQEQRDKVYFYDDDCIAVYIDDVLQMVINPEGYNYARYCYMPGETTKNINRKSQNKLHQVMKARRRSISRKAYKSKQKGSHRAKMSQFIKTCQGV